MHHYGKARRNAASSLACVVGPRRHNSSHSEQRSGARGPSQSVYPNRAYGVLYTLPSYCGPCPVQHVKAVQYICIRLCRRHSLMVIQRHGVRSSPRHRGEAVLAPNPPRAYHGRVFTCSVLDAYRYLHNPLFVDSRSEAHSRLFSWPESSPSLQCGS